MSFSRLLRKFSQPNLARSASPDTKSTPPADKSDKSPSRRQASEPIPTIPRPWRRKRPSTTDRSPPSRPTSIPSLPAKAQDPTTPDGGVREKPLPIPVSTSPGVFLTTFTVEPPPELIPDISSVPDKLREAWTTVRDDPTVTNATRGLNTIGDSAVVAQKTAAPFIPIAQATAAAIQQTDMAKAIKEGIDKFAEGMPLFMNALDELKNLHPFVGVVVLAFKTVYTLQQKRRDNDKKIISLYVGMRDMMGTLLILKDVENDKLIAPDGRSIEDRLKSLVDRTADDIKMCSNVCDTYMKKRLLAKVLLSPVWDAKLLDFVQLFASRRQDFEFELTIHTSQGVDKANVKLDAIGEATSALNEQMNVMKALFQQLVSPEQKQISDLLAAKGGMRALKDDDKVLLELEKAESKASGAPKVEVGRTRREQLKDTTLSADDSRKADELRRDILEDPNAAAEKNLIVFSRKFEAQKNQIIDELSLVVKRESDRVVRELKGGAHERILDKSIHELWTEMGWRGNVKTRHFVLALRDYYLEKLASGSENSFTTSATGIHCTPDPDAWAIKYVDVFRLQPILEAIDDDASGFITIGEMNRFSASRPVDWSMAHWVAFWAVGYKASIIDYANKIEDLFAKMEGVHNEVLPLNRQAVVKYFANVWEPVHTLVAAVLSLQAGQDDPEKFKSYVEAEETRLGNNLKAVDYIIDGTDTLTLITGVGRIEKTVFPLLYLFLKHHYEIMRIMRTKVLDASELWEGVKSISYVQDALRYRVDDLTNNFTQQKLDVEKQFQTFAYGMFKYINDPKALWSGDYVRNLDPRITPYDDANEDLNVNADDILKFPVSDEPSLDFWVYDGHSIDEVPSYDNVEPPLKDILGHWHGYFYDDAGVRETQWADSMMTFVLGPSDGEKDLKANGWCSRGRFTITGSWSNGENDVMQITFKMSFNVTFWNPVFFSGRFDPERDALTGVYDYSAELGGSTAVMEFRRIPPRYLTVYPNIKELSDNKSRVLWKFAISARRDDRTTMVALTVRYLFFGKPLDSEEFKRLTAAVQRLTAADACFYGSMSYRKRAYTLMHDKDGETFDTLDLCCAPESRCIDARITHRENLKGPHEPYHRLVKLRTMVVTRHFGRAYRLACAAFERVEGVCAKIAEASQQGLEEKEGKETGKDPQDELTQETTKTDIPPSSSDKPDDAPVTTDESKDGTEPEQAAAATPSQNDKSEVGPVAVDATKGEAEARSTVTEPPSKDDKPDDGPAAAAPSQDDKSEVGLIAVDATKDEAEGRPTVTGQPSKDDKSDDGPAAATPSQDDKSEVGPVAVDATKDEAEARSTVTEPPSKDDKPDDGPAAAAPSQDDKSEVGPITVDATKDEAESKPTEPPSKDDRPGDGPAPTDGEKKRVEVENNASQTNAQAQTPAQGQDGELPTCGKCHGSLSFPFWHCIFCEDNLFICDACDSEGVPELVRGSGKHTEEHHLIRCLAAAKGDDADPATEQRLISIESRLDSMQTRFDDLGGRIGDLSIRIDNIEQLLHNLPGLVEAALRGGLTP
ncbi:hypothetical protein F5148DRAFT_1319736 [Russula earlei]|uniref:Uncharacterized protein n=1 Tax=Russula earlei TaxID=71964 RepID=A0ACC0U4P5_9AGAM|nr:hypothetical protein F5148DRAFT_1319736 [Russula earlei]